MVYTSKAAIYMTDSVVEVGVYQCILCIFLQEKIHRMHHETCYVHSYDPFNIVLLLYRV